MSKAGTGGMIFKTKQGTRSPEHMLMIDTIGIGVLGTKVPKRKMQVAKGKGKPCSEPLDYRRGVLHGLQAAGNIAANYNQGRSWTAGAISAEIDGLTYDLPQTCVATGDCLNDEDNVPLLADLAGFLVRPKPQRATIRTKKQTHPPTSTR